MSLFLLPQLFLRFADTVIDWMVARPVRILIVALVVVAALLWIGRDRARDLAADRAVQAAAWHGKFTAQKAEMAKLVALVRAARVEAARMDQANIARVRAEWTVHLSEVTHDYQTDLAAARAAVAQRLHAGTGAASHPGGGAGAAMSALPTLSTGPVRPGDAAIVGGADIDACTVNTLRLEHLTDAWERAASIDVSRP